LFAGAGVYKLIRDDEYDALPAAADVDAFGRLFASVRSVLHCSNCRRRVVFWDRNQDTSIYVVEDPGKGSNG
jgi:hypothetical protein